MIPPMIPLRLVRNGDRAAMLASIADECESLRVRARGLSGAARAAAMQQVLDMEVQMARLQAA